MQARPNTEPAHDVVFLGEEEVSLRRWPRGGEGWVAHRSFGNGGAVFGGRSHDDAPHAGDLLKSQRAGRVRFVLWHHHERITVGGKHRVQLVNHLLGAGGACGLPSNEWEPLASESVRDVEEDAIVGSGGVTDGMAAVARHKDAASLGGVGIDRALTKPSHDPSIGVREGARSVGE